MRTIKIKSEKVFCGDPCYTDLECQKFGVWVDSVKNGVWNITRSGEYEGFKGNLRATHESFDDFDDDLDGSIEWSEFVGRVGVDTGMAGFFENPTEYMEMSCKMCVDKAHDRDTIREALNHGKNYVSDITGRGDGSFPVLVKYGDNGEVVAIEIVYKDIWIFAYHHMAVSNKDQIAAAEAVKKHDFEAYKALAEKYVPIEEALEKKYAPYAPICFPYDVCVGDGWITLNDEIFGLVDGIEFECG